VFLIHPYLTETARFTQRKAGTVEVKYAGEDFPETPCLCLFEQCLQQMPPQALASNLTAQVNRKVSDAVIASASAIAAQACPPYNLIVLVKHYQHRITITSLESFKHVSWVSRGGFKRRAPFLNSLVVDGSYRWCVIGLGGTDAHDGVPFVGSNNILVKKPFLARLLGI
jgi:hypothetical protein